ncbi:uncharacterized protein LOC130917925 [Corythoichthys intestinalis]|uniref:uncharacterized protein LOC130917925 n=1 Tax=Corythoichthys intestinalis TaxID=161448 RepID=UPI0025A66742|nr:uncharacterized protein LOC130917925 [Corythoichthys intestinalis]
MDKKQLRYGLAHIRLYEDTSRGTRQTGTMIFLIIILVFTLQLNTSCAVTVGPGDRIIEVTTGEIKESITRVQLQTVNYDQTSPLDITEETKVPQETTTSFTTFLNGNLAVAMLNTTRVMTRTEPPERSTQSQDTEHTVLSSTTKMIHSSTDSNLLSTTTIYSTSYVKNIPTNTDGITTQLTGSLKPSVGTDITKPNKIPETSKEQSNNVPIHSKVVAGLIGAALLVMIVGIVIIFVKKRKLQKQQITTNDWAGPSPFLSHGDDNGQVPLRSSSQIPLVSFLSQRISKRLSFLPEIKEESDSTTTASTFGSTKQAESI